MKKSSYTVNRAARPPSLDPVLGVAPEGWACAETGAIGFWHRKSKKIRPATFFRALYDDENVYVRFDVMDSYVKMVSSKLNDPVCEDSCVEFFIQPKGTKTYFNFEINGGGTMLLYKLIDPTFVRRNGKRTFAKFEPVPAEWAEKVEIAHSLPKTMPSPMTQPVAWTVAFRIPFALFSHCLGKNCSVKKGDAWHGNFFKCGGSEHYGMWCDVGEKLNFHQPDRFGRIVFG